jgi:hypothetical protein
LRGEDKEGDRTKVEWVSRTEEDIEVEAVKSEME